MPRRQAPPRPSPARVFSARFRRAARGAAFCLALLVLSALPALAAQPALVTAVEPGDGTGPQALAVFVSRKPEALRAFTLQAPPRLVLDMSPARLGGGKVSLPSGHALLHGVRAAQFDPRTVRVVLDLKGEAAHVLETRPAGDGGFRIIVSLSPAGQTATGPQSATSAPPAPAAGTTGDEPTPAGQAPAGTSPGGTVMRFGQGGPAGQPAAKPSPWGRLDFSGFLMAKATQELHDDGYPEQPRSLRNTVRVEGKWMPPLPANETRDASGTYVLASAESDYLGFGPDPSSDEYDLEIFEAYAHHAAPGWELRTGRQIVRWGKTDQISPVDNLNPQDMREFFIPDLEERKIPDWMARLRVFPGDLGPAGSIALEAVFIPFPARNEFDWTGNTWALLGAEDPGLRIDEDEPDRGLDHAGYGLRAATTVSGWDLAASWLQTDEKAPRLRLDPFNPRGPTLQADYGRQNIFGLEFETTLGGFGFRGEAAYADRQSLNTGDFDPASSPVSYWVAGLDYIGEADWYANIQLSHQHLFEYDEDTLFLERDNFYLNGELNREFWRGNLMLKLRYAVDIRDGGSFLTPEAILTHFRNLELSLGTNLFFGPRDSLFGRYRDNDQAFLQATYRF